MKENYYSILEYISMFELMDREYYTSIFFEEQGIRSLQVIPRYVLAAYALVKVPGIYLVSHLITYLIR